mmetsp:Transcript_29800/g.46106  ORF Transcript_29800/g.46106 Transcript_29800/m.46106 type:complete len:263 (+) Transcript_29800:3-791(+)
MPPAGMPFMPPGGRGMYPPMAFRPPTAPPATAPGVFAPPLLNPGVVPPLINKMTTTSVSYAAPKIIGPPVSNSVYVGKIAETVGDEFFKELLEKCGEVKKWNRPSDPETGKLKGFGFCDYDNPEGVLCAIEILNGLAVDGSALMVKPSEKTQTYLNFYAEQKKIEEERREKEKKEKEKREKEEKERKRKEEEGKEEYDIEMSDKEDDDETKEESKPEEEKTEENGEKKRRKWRREQKRRQRRRQKRRRRRERPQCFHYLSCF